MSRTASAATPSRIPASMSAEASATFLTHTMAQKERMWQNVLSYLKTPHAVEMLDVFRYAHELAPRTAADTAALACVRLGASAILPGLCGAFLTKKITGTM